MTSEERKEEINHLIFLHRGLDLVASWLILRDVISQNNKLSRDCLVKEITKKKKELINNYDQDQRLIPVHLDSRIKQEMKLRKLVNQ